MEIREIMTREFQACSPQATLREAAQMMRDLNIGMLPIADGDQIVGTVTDRDICCRGVAEGADPQSAQVREVMTKDVVRCYEDQDLREAAKAMEDHQVRRLLIFSRQDRPVGILAQADIALNPQAASFVGELVHDVSEPGPAHRPSTH